MKGAWSAIAGVAVLAASLSLPCAARAGGRPARVVVLDDGEKVSRDRARPLDDGPWPAGPIDLFALRGETLGLQAVIEAGDATVEDARVLVEPFVAGDGRRLDVDVERFVERFVVVERPTGNDHSPDSIAFTRKSAPGSRFLGAIADPLVPEELEVARARPHERAAVWIDLTVPDDAPPGVYRSALLVRDAHGELDSRVVELRVLAARLPFAAAPAFVYYDTLELTRRMGDAGAERDLRQLLHAHHMSAIHTLDRATQSDERQMELDRSAVLGTAFARERGYRGPGEGIGEGVLALGSYGSLGAPTEVARDAAAGLAHAILGDGAELGEGLNGARETAAFVYAVDETCASDWPARWVELLPGSDALRGVRVGETCGAEPSSLGANLVMQTSPDLDPARARFARGAGGRPRGGRGRGTWVWAYNGMRPAAGPMTLDVPATDLRANAWIAMRYGVPRWFYWGATFWFDDNHGGRGGPLGFDPFAVAETFHNQDGDHANGDGILVYPGHQRAPGMTDYGVARVFPSVRLKNLRRGIEDAGYVVLARRVDAAQADAVVRRIIPRALAWAGDRPSWPQHARPWLEARRELARILAGSDADGDSDGAREEPRSPDEGAAVSESCSITNTRRVSSAPPLAALLFLGGMVLALRRFSPAEPGKQRRMATTRKREEAPPSTKPEGHRPSAPRVPTAAADPVIKRSEAPTLPPPPIKPSGIRAKRRTIRPPSATVDEVVADLTNDPRREDDD